MARKCCFDRVARGEQTIKGMIYRVSQKTFVTRSHLYVEASMKYFSN